MRAVGECAIVSLILALAMLSSLGNVIVVHFIEHHLSSIYKFLIDGYMLLVLALDTLCIHDPSLRINRVLVLFAIYVLVFFSLLD